MESFITFVQDWGYIAVLLGSMVEGESVILTASFMAYQGYLSLPKIMIIAFLGTLFADQALYYVGRHYGKRFFKKFPKMQEGSKRAFDLLHRWDIWFILSFRFIYGIRTISPIVIGAARVPPKRFIPLNLLSAIIWTIISCVGGYMLGGTFEVIVENFDSLKKYFVLVPLGILTLGFGIYALFFKKRGDCENEDISGR